MNSRLKREYDHLLNKLYVKDDDEYITAYEMLAVWLPKDCHHITDYYEEIYKLDKETGEYEEIDNHSYENLYDLETELFGETEYYEEAE